MTKRWIYPDMMDKLCAAIADFRHDKIDVVRLQSVFQEGVNTIVAYDEREFRSLLQYVEAQLDMIRFTVSQTDHRNEVLAAVSELESLLSDAARTS